MRRRERLDAYLDERGLAAVWFARPNGFAWLTGGDNVVDASDDAGIAAAGYDGDDLRVLTTNIEADRLAAEELPADAAVESYPWHETDLVDALAARSPTPAAADVDVPGFERANATALRQPLADADVEAYRALGADAAAAVESACRGLSPGTSERAAAAELTGRLADADVRAPVVLVGGAERVRRYRHFTPTDAELGAYALVSVTASRGGLFASLTRTVRFDAPDWYDDRWRASARVASTALAATRSVGRAGGTAADVFARIRDAYAETGFRGEWRRHHQGGAAGFDGREWVATPGSGERVHLPMGYAWNPTVRGTKTEDTWLVTDDGFECLTAGDVERERVPAVDADASLAHALAIQR